MLALGGDGAGVIQLSYGLNSPFMAESALACCHQCNALGMGVCALYGSLVGQGREREHTALSPFARILAKAALRAGLRRGELVAVQ